MSLVSQAPEDRTQAIAAVIFDQVRRSLPEGVHCEMALDRSLYGLGLDSLSVMDVLNAVEEAFGVRFTEQTMYDIDTCRDLVEYVGAHATRGSFARGQHAAALAVPPKVPPVRQVTAEHSDVTLFPECVAFGQRLTDMAAAGLENPFFRVKHRVDQSHATIGGRAIVSYTSFDYLGMARCPRVTAAAKDAIDVLGTSASASRLVGGNHAIVQQLDEELARFLGTESAAVFPSGYGTNASLFGHLFGQEDLILYDELAHNSIVQGAMLSKAARRSFPHNDVDFADRLLRDVRGDYRRVVLAVEGVYSMDGDYPDLPKLIEVKRRHGALLYVDEAHSVGVMGATGRGLCEHYGVDPGDGDLWMGTISKALASAGGYLAGRRVLIEYLKYTTPSFVFATAVSPANAAAALAAVRLLREEPERAERLRDRSRLFLKLAHDCGLNTGNSGDTPVIPIIVGNSQECVRISAALLSKGVDAQPILYPAVPEKASRVRFFITAEHTEEQICRTMQVLSECMRRRAA